MLAAAKNKGSKYAATGRVDSRTRCAREYTLRGVGVRPSARVGALGRRDARAEGDGTTRTDRLASCCRQPPGGRRGAWCRGDRGGWKSHAKRKLLRIAGTTTTADDRDTRWRPRPRRVVILSRTCERVECELRTAVDNKQPRT